MELTGTERLVNSLCLTLMHSVWMGLLLALLAAVLVMFTRKSSAHLRYLVLCGMMLLFLGACGMVFYNSWQQATAGAGINAAITVAQDNRGLFRNGVHGIMDWLLSNAGLITGFWMLVVSIRTCRLLIDWRYVFRIRGNRVYAAGIDWDNRLDELAQAIGVSKGVRLLESALVKVPVVTGHFKPLILVPVGIINQLPAEEVEAVLLHELAHIRRHDYLVNLVQRIAELLFFFNPGLLWISSLIRDERENCCDDLAIGASQDRAVFVQALVSFREYSLRASVVQLGFPGNRGQLVNRLTRIVYNRNKGLSGRELGFVSLNIVLLFLLVVAVNKPLVKSSGGNDTVVAMNNLPVPPTPPMELSPGQPGTVQPRTAQTDRVQTPVGMSMVPQAMVPQAMGQKGLAPKGITGQPMVPPPMVKPPAPPARAVIPSSGMNLFSTGAMADPQPAPVSAGGKYVNGRQSYGGRYPGNGSPSPADQDRADADRAAADQDRRMAERDRQLAEQDRRQAEQDRKQADKDRIQAEYDRKQADKDRVQAENDRKQSVNNNREADKNRIAAEQDRARAAVDRQNAEANRAKALFDRQQAEQDRANAQIEREKAARNRELAELQRAKAAEDRRRSETDRANAEASLFNVKPKS